MNYPGLAQFGRALRLGRRGSESSRKFKSCNPDHLTHINSCMAANNMKETDYYKSGKQKENVLKARKKALESIKAKKQERTRTYELSPTLCIECDTVIEYKKKHNKFCSKSCAGLYNGRNKGKCKAGNKISKSLKQYHNNNPGINKGKMRPGRYCKLYKITCKVCDTVSLVGSIKKDRKTCGNRDCITHASVGMRTYQNGSRKPIWYYNPYENKEVLLESSWEVRTADSLIANKIKWMRPKPIKWIDSNNKSRLYYPDFYLEDYDIYLDPKNPYCIEQDKEKLKSVSKLIKLEYGHIDDIIIFICKLK